MKYIHGDNVEGISDYIVCTFAPWPCRQDLTAGSLCGRKIYLCFLLFGSDMAIGNFSKEAEQDIEKMFLTKMERT